MDAMIIILYQQFKKKNLLFIFLQKNLFSPLDEIIDQLGGTSAVAEMTGRRGRMVRIGGANSQVQYELRSAENSDVGIESLNVKEVSVLTKHVNVST